MIVFWMILAVWLTLCVSSLVGKVAEFIEVVRRIADALDAQNLHYGVERRLVSEEKEADGPIR